MATHRVSLTSLLLLALSLTGTIPHDPPVTLAAVVCPGTSVPGDRISNGGFHTSVAGWTGRGMTWSNQDADACPDSGAVSFDAPAGGWILSDCFTMKPADRYRFSARMKAPATSIYRGVCELFFRTAPNCSIQRSNDTSTTIAIFSGDSPTWQNVEKNVVVPAGVQSASVNCNAGAGGTGQFFFDEIALTPTP